MKRLIEVKRDKWVVGAVEAVNPFSFVLYKRRVVVDCYVAQHRQVGRETDCPMYSKLSSQLVEPGRGSV